MLQPVVVLAADEASEGAALVGTTNLLAAEAYSVEAAIRAYADGAEPRTMRAAAGKAYAKYQKISEGSGLGAFSTDS